MNKVLTSHTGSYLDTRAQNMLPNLGVTFGYCPGNYLDTHIAYYSKAKPTPTPA